MQVIKVTRELWRKLEEDFGNLASERIEYLDREELLELRKLEWFCVEKSVERISWLGYWSAFVVSITVVLVYNSHRDDQMYSEFDKLFDENNGLAFT